MAEISLATILSAAGSAVSGVTALMAANANAKMAEHNAVIAEENAVRTVDRAQKEQEELDLAAAAAVGEQLNDRAASGVSVSTGSSRKTRVAAKELARLDALNLRQAGEIDAYNYKNQAVSHRLDAARSKANGLGSALGSFLQAGTIATQARKLTPTARSYYPTPTPRPQVLK